MRYIDVYEEPTYGYDDWRQEQLAEEGAREFDEHPRIAADEDPDADIGF